MYKAKFNGTIEVGEPWSLTDDDRCEIASIIAGHCGVPTMRKLGGRWIQQNNREIMEGGYRVFDPAIEEANQKAAANA
jgi:hypothetical protein